MKRIMKEISIVVLLGVIVIIINRLNYNLFSKVRVNLDIKAVIYCYIVAVLIIITYGMTGKKYWEIRNFIKNFLYLGIFFSIVNMNIIAVCFNVYLLVILYSVRLNHSIKKKNITNNCIIYDSRKTHLNNFVKVLLETDSTGKRYRKNLVLIDGIWGIGKTEFVEQALESSDVSGHKVIKIDVLVYNTRDALVNQALSEIKKILEDEGIISSSIDDLKKVLRIATESYKIKLSNVLDVPTYECIERELPVALNNLEKPIILVVDNLDRVLNENLIIETLGFLHKIYELVNSNLKIIVLADSSKIRELKNIGKDYLNKFFEVRYYLNRVTLEEILEKIEGISISTKSNFNSAILHMSDILKEYVHAINDEEFNAFAKTKSLEMLSKLGNPRNINQIVQMVEIEKEVYKNIFKDTDEFDENIHEWQIILVCSLRIIASDLLEIDYPERDFCNLLSKNESVLNENIRICKSFENLFLIEFLLKLEYLNNTKKSVVKAKNFYRLIKQIPVSNEVIVKDYIENLVDSDIERDSVEKVLLYLNDYSQYFNNENVIKQKYAIIMDRCGKILKNKTIDSNPIIPLFENEKIMEIDKIYSESSNGKSIFNFIDTIADKNDIILKNIKNSYFVELYIYMKKNLDFKDNSLYINKDEIIAEFSRLYFEKFKKNNFKEIIDDINYNSKSKDDYELIKSLKNLRYRLTKIDYQQTSFSLSQFNQALLISKQEELKNNGVETIQVIKKTFEIENELKEIINKNLNCWYNEITKNARLISNNYKINRGISRTHLMYIKVLNNMFYRLIAEKLGDLYQNTNFFRFEISVIGTLIEFNIKRHVKGEIVPLIRKIIETDEVFIENQFIFQNYNTVRYDVSKLENEYKNVFAFNELYKEGMKRKIIYHSKVSDQIMILNNKIKKYGRSFYLIAKLSLLEYKKDMKNEEYDYYQYFLRKLSFD